MVRRRTKLCILVLNILAGLALPHTEVMAARDTTPSSVVLGEIKQVSGNLGLHNTIEVEVENLSAYLKQPGKDAGKFVLYLDWRPIRGLNSRVVQGTDKLMFDIRRTEASEKEWDNLLGRPKGYTDSVYVSVGYGDENPVASKIEYPLVVISKGGFLIFLAAFALVLVFFFWLVKTSSIIRDTCKDVKKPEEKTFSLGRTQMAFWFFIVAVSYVFIWLVTGEVDTLTGSALSLIGISTATALSSAAVSSSKENAVENKHLDLKKEEAVLKARLSEIEKQITAGTAAIPPELTKEKTEKSVRLDQVTNEIRDLKKAMNPFKSEGFLKDILNDVSGVSLHRFQIAVWTVVLGFIFLVSIYNNLAMPEFSETLLGLMGISAGTYIGFKFPEKQA